MTLRRKMKRAKRVRRKKMKKIIVRTPNKTSTK
jgi:hypothetical protein